MKTAFSNRSRTVAIAVGLVWLAALGGTLAASRNTTRQAQTATEEESDQLLYRSVVQRLRDGENYWDALGSELRGRGYGVNPVWHWRTPLHLWLLSLLPPFVPVAVLGLLSVWLAYLQSRALPTARARAWGMALLATLFVGFPASADFGVGWAGALAALSVTLAPQRLWAAIVFAGLALFFRELAAPYALLLVAFCAWKRRWKEFGALVLIIAGYAAYLGWHYQQVLARITDADEYYAPWSAMLGWAGLRQAGHWMGVLKTLPASVGGVIFVTMLVGFAAIPSRPLLKWTGAAYLLLLVALAGPDNIYWALMLTGLFAQGTLWLPAAGRDLIDSWGRAEDAEA